MHILFLTDNFPPEVNAPASRTFEHCREWVKAGHRVTVITCAPNFPTGRLHPGYRNHLLRRERMEGIEVVRVWSYIAANEGVVRRTLDYASFMISAVLAAPFVRGVDVVVATSPQFFTACAGAAVAAMLERPFVFELRDLWPASLRAVGAIGDAFMLAALERLELFLYRRAAAVVAVTRAFKADLVGRGVDGDKITVVTNGVDLTRFFPKPREAALADRYGLAGKFVVGYIGTHGMAHGLDTVLETARLLQSRPEGQAIYFLLLGDGACKRALQSKAEQWGLTSVIFLQTVSRDEVARYWSLLDVFVIHLKADPLFATVIPSKLFEGMAMGAPVLHGVGGESARIVEEEGVGLTFEPENPAAMASALTAMAAKEDMRRQMATRARLAALRYDRRVLAADMLRVLEQTVRQTRTVPAFAHP